MISKETEQKLTKLAIKASEKSYSPYSKFRVGAALLTSSGNIYTAANVENASYGAGICAERSAAVKAVSEGDREFVAIAIFGAYDGASEEKINYAFPCGICRQFLNEFAVEGMEVLVCKTPDDYIKTTLDELLPNSFGPKDLE
jgi:cytidine deaminase